MFLRAVAEDRRKLVQRPRLIPVLLAAVELDHPRAIFAGLDDDTRATRGVLEAHPRFQGAGPRSLPQHTGGLPLELGAECCLQLLRGGGLDRDADVLDPRRPAVAVGLRQRLHCCFRPGFEDARAARVGAESAVRERAARHAPLS